RLLVAIAAITSILQNVAATSQDQKTTQASSEAQALTPPEHPITEEQLRTYYNVCHIPSLSRQLTHEKMEVQRKQLPEWYIQSVWDEIEDAIDDIDLPKVALPVYQKYISEADANFLIRFMATPQGQKMLQSVLTRDVQAQHAGAAPIQARDQALAKLARNEAEEVEHIVSSMSAKDLRDLESRFGHWQQMQPVLAQMRTETGQVTMDEQMKLMKAIVAKHQSELANANHSYETSHPSVPGSQAHQ
ncbi:MAG: hypothetical protein WBX02_18985, partial [Terriglobales bacterium]